MGVGFPGSWKATGKERKINIRVCERGASV